MIRLIVDTDGLDRPNETVDLVGGLLWDCGTTGIVEDGDVLLAGFDDRATAAAAAERAVDWPVTVASIEAVEWTGSDDVTTVTVAAADRPTQTLSIVAGPTFGHGHHPTTALALDLLSAAIRPGDRVIDVGTGSGVLAIAARALGAGAVIGIDHDEAAIPVAEANARANGASVTFSSEPIPRAAARTGISGFDIVVANLLLPVHRALAPAMAAVLAPGGTLLTTGYLVGDAVEAEAIHRRQLVPVGASETVTAGEWAGHRFRTGRS
jgi:ribosomal protein L11 methylase PrmA